MLDRFENDVKLVYTTAESNSTLFLFVLFSVLGTFVVIEKPTK